MPTSKSRKIKRQRIQRSLSETSRQASGHSSLSALEVGIVEDPQLLAARLQLLLNRKQAAVRQGRSILTRAGWEGLLLVPAADIALTACGGSWPETKNMPQTANWSTQLRWGLDQFVEIHRLLAAGLTYGALLTTRLFLERWTINISVKKSLYIAENEAESAYINRTWSTLGNLITQRMGDEWAWLSECLHGRGDYTDVLGSDLFIDGSNFKNQSIEKLSERISRISSSVFIVILLGIDGELHNAKLTNVTPPHLIEINPPSSELLEDIASSPLFASQFPPLDPIFVFSEQARVLTRLGQEYRSKIASYSSGSRDAARLERDFLSGLLERRARSLDLATRALTTEALFTEPASGRAYLLARLFRYGAIAQGAILVAGRSRTQEADALRTAAAALESTWKLWLDDADTCLGCCRGLLEQTARARVHRLKPAKAKKMEESRNGPSRWIEEAKLKRLNEFGRALGEFSHLKLSSRRVEARKKLTDFQNKEVPHAEQTARLHALDTSAYFLAKEVYSRLLPRHPKLASAFLKTVTLFDESGHEAFEDESMNRALKLRDGDWGHPDFLFFDNQKI